MGDKSERQWKLFRSLAERIKVRWPDAKVVFLAYGFTKNAPQSFDTFPDNVVVELTIWRDYEAKFRNWQKFRKLPKLAYVYFYGTYNSTTFSPAHSPASMAKDIKTMADNGIVSIFKCGWATLLGNDGPGCYVFSKMLEDPYCDYHDILEDFYKHAYGNSYSAMKKYFETLFAAMDTAPGTAILDVLEKTPRNTEQMYSAIYRSGVINAMEEYLQLAEQTVNPDPRVRARIALVRREFDYMACRARLISYVSTFHFSKSPALLPLIEKELQNRASIVNKWYDAKGLMKHEPGFDWYFMEDAPKDWVLYGGGQIPPSFPREVDNGIQPLKDMIAVGKLPSQNIIQARKGPAKAEPVHFGKGVAPTSVSVSYDDKNLYFDFECQFENLKWGVGEAKAWANERGCLEQEYLKLCISPDGSKDRWFEFRFNPMKDSGTAIRPGYDDPQNPNYGNAANWKSHDWKYTFELEPEKMCWRANVVIPYATIDMTPPAAGAFVEMNFVRNYAPYPPAFNDGRSIIAAWSRAPGERDVAKPANYGKVMFTER